MRMVTACLHFENSQPMRTVMALRFSRIGDDETLHIVCHTYFAQGPICVENLAWPRAELVPSFEQKLSQKRAASF